MSEVEQLCRKLCDAEATYLNINVISKTQVCSPNQLLRRICSLLSLFILVIYYSLFLGAKSTHQVVRDEVWMPASQLPQDSVWWSRPWSTLEPAPLQASKQGR